MSADTDLAASLNSDLGRLRDDIDRIDLAMHELLMERGRIIDHLIAIKAKQGGGSAFRPGREASMMAQLAKRHKGLLPLDTAEGIWRIIIATFTYVQANFSVHVDVSAGDARMRDSARFHFGFTVPYIPHDGAREVIAAVAASSGDLGMVRIEAGMAAGPWWRALEGERAPKIIARLPFVERPDHPAGLPVFTISLPLNEAAARDTIIWSAEVVRWREEALEQLGKLGVEVLGDAGTALGLAMMIAAPGLVTRDAIAAAFAQAGISDVRLREIGSHAARYEVP
ncbi:MAG: chorismate mutase [Beijerinckiaceae bacterium]